MRGKHPPPRTVNLDARWLLAGALCLGVTASSLAALAWAWTDAMATRDGILEADVNSRGEGWLEMAMFSLAAIGTMAVAVRMASSVSHAGPRPKQDGRPTQAHDFRLVAEAGPTAALPGRLAGDRLRLGPVRPQNPGISAWGARPAGGGSLVII